MNFSTRAIAALTAFVRANTGSEIQENRRAYVFTEREEWDRALNAVDREAASLFILRTASMLPTIHARHDGALADIGEHLLASAIVNHMVEATRQAWVSEALMGCLLEAASFDVQAAFAFASEDCVETFE